MARRRFNFFGKRNRLRRGSNLSDEGATEKIEEILSEECGSRKLEAVPSAKVRNPSWLLAKQTGGRCFREARTYIWRLGVLTTATRRSLVRSLASHDRLTQHMVLRARDATTFILKPSHALLDDHTLWDPINEPEISQRPLIKHENRILGECSE